MKKIIGMLVALSLLVCGCAFADEFDASRDITVVSREEGSGTRGAFVELLGVEQKNEAGEKIDYTTDEAIVTNSTAVCMTTVASKLYAIGYLSMGSLNDTVKALSIDGALPTVENVRNGSYAVARPFNVAVREDASELARDFIAYILSEQGQAVAEANGYVASVEAPEAYASSGLEGTLVVAGSSSVTPVMEKLAEAYRALNPNAEIEVQQSDSTTGISAVSEGVCDIGMASRELKQSELDAGLTPSVIAMDGIAVIVNPGNPWNELTAEQVRAVYTGEALTWDELGE